VRILDLFSGIGGFSLAAQWIWGDDLEIVGFCEIEKYAQKVLQKNFPSVPIYEDITKLDGKQFNDIDIITGGFPCQDISIAGKGAGIEGSRSGLWSEMHRIISEVQPRYALIENVPMLIHRGLERVLCDLTESGFDCEWQTVGADDVGVWHRRKRIWIVAYPRCDGGWNNESKNVRLCGDKQTEKTIGSASQPEIARSSKESEIISKDVIEDTIGIRFLDGESKKERVEVGKFGEFGTGGGERVYGENKDVSDTDNDGRNRSGRKEICREDDKRKENKGIRRTGADDIEPQDSDGGIKREPEIGRSDIVKGDDQKNKTSAAEGVCGLYEKPNIGKGTFGKDGNQENDSRTLVQVRPSGVQPPINRGLGENKTTSERSNVQRGNNLFGDNRMDGKTDVPDTRHNVINGGRIFKHRKDKEKEGKWKTVGVGGRNKTKKCTGIGKTDVSDTDTTRFKNRIKEHRGKQTSKRAGVGGSGGCDIIPNTDTKGLEGHRKECELGKGGKKVKISGSSNVTNSDSSRQQECGAKQKPPTQFTQGSSNYREQPHGSTEQQMGFVANGVSFGLDGYWEREPKGTPRVTTGEKDRVNKLKGLGNAIVPQVAYEIMKRIKDADRRH